MVDPQTSELNNLKMDFEGLYNASNYTSTNVYDHVRKHSEACDSLHAVQIIHSAESNTGSTMTNELLLALRD